ncbi:GyrI-like domain-containing protein [Sphingomonas colocasiae]|uniref:GyrI-like domain-containing protein n=1 Tax=Sphingomonas colocasiae TaxID=1848973 RepID=A0ABS7PY94_9SPHN|nr:GyrI-like domain-containing protein [Sphingomonas colocasiae]
MPIEVPQASYLMVDGHGDPNSAPAYRQAVESLYATAYAIKFASKAEGRDFVVPPLEGLWSARDPHSFTARRKDEWDWTMMIMMPDHVNAALFAAAESRARAKLGHLPGSLRLESLEEGLCLQALHIGSYDDEGPLLARLHGEVMISGGYGFAGRHHEIYLSDPRKVAPGTLRTLIRQPVRKI